MKVVIDFEVFAFWFSFKYFFMFCFAPEMLKMNGSEGGNRKDSMLVRISLTILVCCLI